MRNECRIRSLVDFGVRIASCIAACIVVGMLVWVLTKVLWRGTTAMASASFDSAMSEPVSGLLPAIGGSLGIVALAFAMAAPLGLAAAVYIAEADKQTIAFRTTRFAAAVLSGTPSILVGAVVYLALVRLGAEPGWFAGSLALAAMMLPMIATTTSSQLSRVSPSLREAALALGTPSWRILVQIMFRAAARKIVSSNLLCVGRVTGQVAPLLLLVPIASTRFPTLHVQAYLNFLTFDAATQSYAWATALMLTVIAVVFVLLGRLLDSGEA